MINWLIFFITLHIFDVITIIFLMKQYKKLSMEYIEQHFK